MTSTPIISIVDDDESVRTAMGCLIRSLGYEAYAFSSAEAFLQSPYLDKTACLIADVQMPRISGLDLQARLREEGREIPIIFITAFPEKRLRARALERGAICFLSKPFDSKVLIDCLAKAVARSAERGE